MTDLTDILSLGSVEAAPQILGCNLSHRLKSGQVLSGRIVEVEAYRQDDPASHTFSGPSLRNEAMFMRAGTSYVYFTYGMHFCINIVCGAENYGEAILIRALEPLAGIDVMWQSRFKEEMPPPSGPNLKKLHTLTNGPAKLTKSLGISKVHNKVNLLASQSNLQLAVGKRPKKIIQTTRVGISKATYQPWRWYDSDSQFVSH